MAEQRVDVSDFETLLGRIEGVNLDDPQAVRIVRLQAVLALGALWFDEFRRRPALYDKLYAGIARGAADAGDRVLHTFDDVGIFHRQLGRTDAKAPYNDEEPEQGKVAAALVTANTTVKIRLFGLLVDSSMQGWLVLHYSARVSERVDLVSVFERMDGKNLLGHQTLVPGAGHTLDQTVAAIRVAGDPANLSRQLVRLLTFFLQASEEKESGVKVDVLPPLLDIARFLTGRFNEDASVLEQHAALSRLLFHPNREAVRNTASFHLFTRNVLGAIDKVFEAFIKTDKAWNRWHDAGWSRISPLVSAPNERLTLTAQMLHAFDMWGEWSLNMQSLYKRFDAELALGDVEDLRDQVILSGVANAQQLFEEIVVLRQRATPEAPKVRRYVQIRELLLAKMPTPSTLQAAYTAISDGRAKQLAVAAVNQLPDNDQAAAYYYPWMVLAALTTNRRDTRTSFPDIPTRALARLNMGI